MVTVERVRRVASALPRTEEHLIRDRVKFRVGRIVYVAISADEEWMGFAFPKEERAALVFASVLMLRSHSMTGACHGRSTPARCLSGP